MTACCFKLSLNFAGGSNRLKGFFGHFSLGFPSAAPALSSLLGFASWWTWPLMTLTDFLVKKWNPLLQDDRVPTFIVWKNVNPWSTKFNRTPKLWHFLEEKPTSNSTLLLYRNVIKINSQSNISPHFSYFFHCWFSFLSNLNIFPWWGCFMLSWVRLILGF